MNSNFTFFSPHISLLTLGQEPKAFMMCNEFTGPLPVGYCSVLALAAISERQRHIFWCVPGNISGMHACASVYGFGFT